MVNEVYNLSQKSCFREKLTRLKLKHDTNSLLIVLDKVKKYAIHSLMFNIIVLAGIYNVSELHERQSPQIRKNDGKLRSYSA
jgi:hypothetical protein